MIIDDTGAIRSSNRFRFVADDSGLYKKSISWLINYARQVFLVQGSVSEILQESINSDTGMLQGFVLHVADRAPNLDTLQHTLMHLKFGIRAAVLIQQLPEKIKTFSLKHLNELAGGPWSFLNCVRRMALSCMREQDSKDTHIRWPDDDSIECAPLVSLSNCFFYIHNSTILLINILGHCATLTSTVEWKP